MTDECPLRSKIVDYYCTLGRMHCCKGCLPKCPFLKAIQSWHEARCAECKRPESIRLKRVKAMPMPSSIEIEVDTGAKDYGLPPDASQRRM